MKERIVKVVCSILAVVLVLCGCNDSVSWQEQYDLGVRYLSEGNYQEAVLSFLNAIEIDPKQPPAYSGAAEAYLALGERSAAVEILNQGIRETDDIGLKEEVEKLQNLPEEKTDSAETEVSSEKTATSTAATVVDGYCDSIVDGVNYLGEPFIHCYHIPRIVPDDGRTISANEQIYEELYGMIQNEVYGQDVPWIHTLLYGWGQKDGYVSLVVESYSNMFEWCDYYVYTVSLETGEFVSDYELLSIYGYTEDTFYDAVKDRMLAYFADREEMLRPNIGDSFFQELIANTTMDENVRQTIPFVGEEGELYILVNVYSPAGSASYWHLWALEKTDVYQLECSVDHSA